jgi:hypothetical protein
MAELRPYNPTWRDRLAQALMGDARPSSARRSFVEGLTGSTGLGTTGMGLVDVTPAGIPLAAQEAKKDFASGNYLAATLGAVAVAPAAKPAAKAAQTGIRAFHGSPHDFNRFDLSKIGTGEGAQAYGHGLYFAESEEVAKAYRDALRPGKGAAPEDTAARLLDASGGNREAALAEMRRRIEDANARGVPYDQIKELMQARNIINTQPERATGRMYEVNIKASPDDFLDYDKPLPPGSPVAEIVARNAERVLQDTSYGGLRNDAKDALLALRSGNMTGEGAYDKLALLNAQIEQMGGGRTITPNREAATQALREAGIPGLKYLDQGSRAAGDGSRNYVVFDDALVEILRKYGLTGLLGLGAVGGAYQSQTQGNGS